MKVDAQNFEQKVDEVTRVGQALEKVKQEMLEPLNTAPIKRSVTFGANQVIEIPSVRKPRRTYEQMEQSMYIPDGKAE